MPRMEVIRVQWTSAPENHRGAWARVSLEGLDGILLVATSRATGERRITKMVLAAGAGDDLAQVLRELPMSRLEFFLRRLPDLPSEVEQWVRDPGDDYDTKITVDDALTESIYKEWNRADGETVRLGEVWATSSEGDGERPALTRPGSEDPDIFYRRVATAYTEVMGRTRAVAPELASEAGVPVRTVHGWIREARRRGFLPAGQRGKA